MACSRALVLNSKGLHVFWIQLRAVPLSPPAGLVELVPNSDTLRKIQLEYGLAGSFKDKPLAEWLRKHNPTEEEYERVSARG